MTGERKPSAFRVEPARKDTAAANPTASRARSPRALSGAELAVVEPAEIDVFDAETLDAAAPPPPPTGRRRSRLGAIFAGAAGLLVSLALGLWVDALVRDLFSRADWLGWLAAGLAAVAGLALAAIVARETVGVMRLASVEKLRRRAVDAVARADMKAARRLVDDLSDFLAARAETAAGRRMLAELGADVIDAPDLVRLAETELLAPLDRQAQKLVLDAGKRVSVVTAVSPRALVDLGYVLFESARLIRRVAELYGGRPGTIGFFRLLRSVLSHLAVTGSIAAGDSLVQQVLGHGLAARLSARLGEGVVNGMMTVRIGIAAMDAARPLPFMAVKRPGMGDFLAALARFAGESEKK